MNSNGFYSALDKALNLEIEGHEFYMQCAEHTTSREGQEFFRYLAGEELIHYDKIVEIYKKRSNRGYCEYRNRIKKMKKADRIFEKHVPGGNLDKRSDALDALNIAIRVEDNSIKLYHELAEKAEKPDLRRFFKELLGEEEKHRSLLETEIEFLTETGSFKDFKVVTS
ncbi:MAG: ferritin family protein [Candidatus Altiarchaeota archaeon]|nr:ferritin family protein [Candidatus Altiarchaeota archaeon]